MNKLEIINLTKTYKHKNANEGINLTLESGVYGLLGQMELVNQHL